VDLVLHSPDIGGQAPLNPYRYAADIERDIVDVKPLTVERTATALERDVLRRGVAPANLHARYNWKGLRGSASSATIGRMTLIGACITPAHTFLLRCGRALRCSESVTECGPHDLRASRLRD
jgi:hypothetical protein